MKFWLQQTYPVWLWTEPVEVKRVLHVVTHAPWRSENPAEEKIRLANEARLRTRRARRES